MEGKITSPEGKLLRVNRSIQAEGTFAYIKEDLDFRQFLLRGKEKVKAEWLLFSLALNILKLIIKSKINAWERLCLFRKISPLVYDPFSLFLVTFVAIFKWFCLL